jgi:hypothetical protein
MNMTKKDILSKIVKSVLKWLKRAAPKIASYKEGNGTTVSLWRCFSKGGAHRARLYSWGI